MRATCIIFSVINIAAFIIFGVVGTLYLADIAAAVRDSYPEVAELVMKVDVALIWMIYGFGIVVSFFAILGVSMDARGLVITCGIFNILLLTIPTVLTSIFLFIYAHKIKMMR